MRHRDLRKVLLGALAAAGCRGDEVPRRSSRVPASMGTEFEQVNACGVDHLRRALELDYLGYRVGRSDHPRVLRTAESGVPCPTSSSPRDCQRQLDTPIAGTSKQQAVWLVARRGDEIRQLTRAGLAPQIGTIDDAAKVVWAVEGAGHVVDCATRWLRETYDGYEVRVQQHRPDECPERTYEVTLRVSPTGEVFELGRRVTHVARGCVGRRPAGYRDVSGTGEEIGGYFASIARLEAASIVAFEILVEELLAHGAPARLVRAARRARLDEIAHASLVGSLAARFGGHVDHPIVARHDVRTLEAIARDNVVEGCVRETWGALEAAWQSRHASTREVRRAMAQIAADELRHASLAWQIDAWLGARLDERTRRTAIDAAVADLATALARDPAPQLRELAGLPSEADAAALLGALHDRLWLHPHPSPIE